MSNKKRTSKRKTRVPNRFENIVCDLNKKKNDDEIGEIANDKESSENGKQDELMIGDIDEQAFKTSVVINDGQERNSKFIKVEYRDTNGNVTRTKKVNVEYSWKQDNNKKIPQGNIGKGQAMRGNMGYRNDRGVRRVEYRHVNARNIDKRNVIEKNVMEGNKEGNEKNTTGWESLENYEERNDNIEDVMEDVTHNGKCMEDNEIEENGGLLAVFLLECGDSVASIKRRHRALSSDGVRELTTVSRRNRLKSDLKDSTL
ncbi:hypothetical protein Tco_0195257 [Tanacetum coccineum]